MIVKEILVNIRCLEFRQDREDADYGACLYARFYFNLDTYGLTIVSDVEDLEMMGLNIPPEQEQMFVASVEGNVHGAGVLAYEDFMDKASERVGGQSFFILPSSIHELLIIPDNGNFDLKSLENMVKEVIATTVDPADQLTDNVYHYDAKDKVFELGEKFVERQTEKDTKINGRTFCFPCMGKIMDEHRELRKAA